MVAHAKVVLCVLWPIVSGRRIPKEDLDSVYLATFEATGCPNKAPDTKRWRGLDEETVVYDMFEICDHTRRGKKGVWTEICCGDNRDSCDVVTCTEHESFVAGPSPEPAHHCQSTETWSDEKRKWCCENEKLGCNDSVYLATFEATGCPNKAPKIDPAWWAWWRENNEETVVYDMFEICRTAGTRTEGVERKMCCGDRDSCDVTCTEQKSFVAGDVGEV
jgi:hypothetical protein